MNNAEIHNDRYFLRSHILVFPSRPSNVDHCFLLQIVGDLIPDSDVELTIGFFLITPDVFRNNKRIATTKFKIYDDDRYGKFEICNIVD